LKKQTGNRREGNRKTLREEILNRFFPGKKNGKGSLREKSIIKKEEAEGGKNANKEDKGFFLKLAERTSPFCQRTVTRRRAEYIHGQETPRPLKKSSGKIILSGKKEWFVREKDLPHVRPESTRKGSSSRAEETFRGSKLSHQEGDRESARKKGLGKTYRLLKINKRRTPGESEPRGNGPRDLRNVLS